MGEFIMRKRVLAFVVLFVALIQYSRECLADPALSNGAEFGIVILCEEYRSRLSAAYEKNFTVNQVAASFLAELYKADPSLAGEPRASAQFLTLGAELAQGVGDTREFVKRVASNPAYQRLYLRWSRANLLATAESDKVHEAALADIDEYLLEKKWLERKDMTATEIVLEDRNLTMREMKAIGPKPKPAQGPSEFFSEKFPIQETYNRLLRENRTHPDRVVDAFVDEMDLDRPKIRGALSLVFELEQDLSDKSKKETYHKHEKIELYEGLIEHLRSRPLWVHGLINPHSQDGLQTLSSKDRDTVRSRRRLTWLRQIARIYDPKYRAHAMELIAALSGRPRPIQSAEMFDRVMDADVDSRSVAYRNGEVTSLMETDVEEERRGTMTARERAKHDAAKNAARAIREARGRGVRK
jgi:hypothetical protein